MVILLLLSPTSLNADPILIARTCDRSRHSDYCNACFDSRKAITSHQDLRGLSGSTIMCAFNQVMSTRGKFCDCSSNAMDGDLVSRCFRCVDRFDSAIDLMMEGMRMWRKWSYGDSKALFESASGQVFNCSYEWMGLSPPPEELKLVAQVGDSSGYIYASSGTLNQLLPDYDPNKPPVII
ncbi:hypothetical protein LINPERPRIM_LOCUS34700 [Linum perenne]